MLRYFLFIAPVQCEIQETNQYFTKWVFLYVYAVCPDKITVLIKTGNCPDLVLVAVSPF